MNNIEKALEILQLTQDGDKLSPRQLKLLEMSVNGFLSEVGQESFSELHKKVLGGNYQEWFHDIEGLTKDHHGYIYWKGDHVEHYSFRGDYEVEKAAAQELAARCKHLEAIGVEPSVITAIWQWEEYQNITPAQSN
ncbi:hypothetical protein Cylst_5241 [Cylindrospermum stagnale PCC 7417]|uniref:Uncharacterized protein n=1 Tax=Cylindrospermum stagnale PCC 7417 TaxID=56107 RepID=K9X3P1_9NOST|nr:hypothetical protein [Cylindrospermum stagnale]AFZ27275.1 hypothetical protein Cylst_5241 [Cylindrospermum stagnale PCC 7417]